MRNDLSSKCALISLPHSYPFPIISDIISVDSGTPPKNLKINKLHCQAHKKLTLPTNVRVKKLLHYSHFLPSAVSRLANLNDIVSFHTANVFFINQQAF